MEFVSYIRALAHSSQMSHLNNLVPVLCVAARKAHPLVILKLILFLLSILQDKKPYHRCAPLHCTLSVQYQYEDTKLTSITCLGKRAISATWIPKLWSHTPGLTWYSRVSESSDVTAVTCWFDTVVTSSASRVSSWKCVANRQNAFTSLARFLGTHSCQLVVLSGTYPRTYNFLYLLCDSPCNATALVC